MAGEGARGQGTEAEARGHCQDDEGLPGSAEAPERDVAPTRGVHLRNPRAVTHPCMVRCLPLHPPKRCMRVPSSSVHTARRATTGPHGPSSIVAERNRGVRGPSRGLGPPARQHNCHPGASLRGAGRVDAPVVGGGYCAHDGESEARAAAPTRLGPVKAVEDTGSLGFRDSGPVVLDGQLHLVLAGRHTQAHQTAFGRVLDRVAREIVQRLGETIGIRVQRPSSFACQLEAPIGGGGEALEEVADERLELDVLRRAPAPLRPRGRARGGRPPGAPCAPSSMRAMRSVRRTSSALGAAWRASTSSWPRMTVSGVRSSCDASATNARWPANASSRRSSM